MCLCVSCENCLYSPPVRSSSPLRALKSIIPRRPKPRLWNRLRTFHPLMLSSKDCRAITKPGHDVLSSCHYVLLFSHLKLSDEICKLFVRCQSVSAHLGFINNVFYFEYTLNKFHKQHVLCVKVATIHCQRYSVTSKSYIQVVYSSGADRKKQWWKSYSDTIFK